jgi:hypothetical protein
METVGNHTVTIRQPLMETVDNYLGNLSNRLWKRYVTYKTNGTFVKRWYVTRKTMVCYL